MPSFAHCTLVGHLTRDPESKQVNNGTNAFNLVVFTVAVNTYKKGDEQASFYECEAWGKQADFCEKYLKKGQAVLVSGEIRIDTWDRKDGGKAHKTVVKAIQVKSMGKDTASGKQVNKPKPVTASVPAIVADEDLPF